MGLSVDWVSIETHYRAGVKSVNALAKESGVTEGAIRARAKKRGWLRDPEGTKREMVKAAMSGITNGIPNYEVRNIIETEANQDVADMQDGLSVSRLCIRRLKEMAEKVRDPREVKVIAEANKVAVEVIRRIRGLDENPGGNSKSVEDILGSLMEKQGEPR